MSQPRKKIRRSAAAWREGAAYAVAIVAAVGTGAATTLPIFALFFGTLLASLGVIAWPLLRPKPAPTQRHATVQPGKILVTVGMTERPCMKTDLDMVSAGQELADADIAIDIFPEERRAKVVKYRYGPTDLIEPVVVVVKVPGS